MRPHRLTVLALTSVILLGGAACSSSDGASNATTTTGGATTTTTTTAAPTTVASTTTTLTAPPTTVAPTTVSTPPTTLPAKATTPEAAAKGLYAAWKAGDKVTAATYGEPAAVTKIFQRAYTGPDLQFMGCEPDGAVFACAYYYEGGARSFRVQGDTTAGYKVIAINDIAD